MDIHKLIDTYFAKVGLEPEIAAIYAALHIHGPQHIASLSRTAGVERTKIYRLLDTLEALHLIEPRNGNNLITPSPVSTLRAYLAQRQQVISSLQNELPQIEALLAHTSLKAPQFHTQIYRGQAAITQLLWHQTTAQTPIYCLDTLQPHTRIPATEQRTIREQHVANATEVFVLSNSKKETAYATERRLLLREHTPVQPTYLAVYDTTIIHLYIDSNELYGQRIEQAAFAAAQRTCLAALWDVHTLS